MRITKPGKYRMRNGGVAVITNVLGRAWGYVENDEPKSVPWWDLRGRFTLASSINSGLDLVDESPDEPQPTGELKGRLLGAQDAIREEALSGKESADAD